MIFFRNISKLSLLQRGLVPLTMLSLIACGGMGSPFATQNQVNQGLTDSESQNFAAQDSNPQHLGGVETETILRSDGPSSDAGTLGSGKPKDNGNQKAVPADLEIASHLHCGNRPCAMSAGSSETEASFEIVGKFSLPNENPANGKTPCEQQLESNPRVEIWKGSGEHWNRVLKLNADPNTGLFHYSENELRIDSGQCQDFYAVVVRYTNEEKSFLAEGPTMACGNLGNFTDLETSCGEVDGPKETPTSPILSHKFPRLDEL